MNIYFAGSIRAGREDKELYLQIIQLLTAYGNILTEHVGDAALSQWGNTGAVTDIYTKDLNWLQQADVMIAEVTQPSLGVGYEIAKAEEWGKKIICLYRPSPGRRLSAMIAGSPHVTVKEYQTLTDLEPILQEFFQEPQSVKRV